MTDEEPQPLTFKGYAFARKTVGDGGDSGRVYVPKDWKGKKVAVVLLEPPEEENGKE